MADDRQFYIEYRGDSIELPLGETVVGRDVGCRLRFNDPAVSRRHLRFIRRAEEVFLEDLGSSNGTLLNGARVHGPRRVLDGDHITVGSRTLIVKVAENDDDATMRMLTLAIDDAAPVDVRALTMRTAQIAAPTIPPINRQQCPQCGADVSDADDECAACHFQWGGFRATSRTDVRGGRAQTADPTERIDRRRDERAAVELQLVYVSSELEIEATTRDLSTSGVFVCSQVLDPIGTECQLTILVDGGPPLNVRGVVRRVVDHDPRQQRESGLGVEFVGLGAADRTWLETVIARAA